MKITLENYNNINAIEMFLQQNHVFDYQLEKENKNLMIEVNDNNIPLIRHFKYYDIFEWSHKGIENVRLWEKPGRCNDVINEFKSMFNKTSFDIITSIEARGFILGGLFLHALNKPFLTIRKHKLIYDTLNGIPYTYTNWKGKKEKLYLFENKFHGKKAMVIDDIMETGGSLKAAVEMLKKQNIKVIGAFYLCDTSSEEVRNQFDFPIRSLLRFTNLSGNNPIN